MVAETMTSVTPSSAAALDAIYNEQASSRVSQAQILVVGAGGVGCELVKNLAATGFGSITLIDLDTIDVSNLNRQFLFRKHHVGKSKAEKAAESIHDMFPSAKINGFVGNIKDARFGVSFFKQFHLVCNALDNLEARRHVNRLCLAANIPLIESGSTGYVGQCAVIGKGYECYDCTGRPPQESYAVCTIRSTPDKPVHCVVWAKFLFELIFGPQDDGNVLKDLDSAAESRNNTTLDLESDTNGSHRSLQQPSSVNIPHATENDQGQVDTENGVHGKDHNQSADSNAAIHTHTIENEQDQIGTENGVQGKGHNQSANSNAVSNNQNIENEQKQVGTENGTQGNDHNQHAQSNADAGHEESPQLGEVPHVNSQTKRIRYADGEDVEEFAARVCQRVFVDDINNQIRMIHLWKERRPPIAYDVNSVAAVSPVIVDNIDLLDQQVWSKEQSAAVFKATLLDIVAKRRAEIGNLSFDKDDRHALMFVAAAANLRAYAYGVPLQSPFAVKGIAGNIVHAVATTNAIVGGLIVLEALKIIVNCGNVDKCKTTFVNRVVTGNRVKTILISEPLKAANKSCFVCSKGQLHLSIDVGQMTLENLVAGVLKGKLSILQPGVHVKTGDYHNTLYECGVGLEDDEIETYNENLVQTLRALRVEDGSELVVEDFAQNLRTTLHVTHVEGHLADNPKTEQFSLDGDVAKATPTNKVVPKMDEAEDLDNDSLVEVPIESARVEPLEKHMQVDGIAERTEGSDGLMAELGQKKRSLKEAGNGSTSDMREAKRIRRAS